MLEPNIEGLEILDRIGEGACGAVYIARPTDATLDKKWLAVRVFNSLAVNIPLIEGMMGRLKGGTYPEGLVHLSWEKSSQGGLCVVMPLLADADHIDAQNIQPGQAVPVTPRTLQQQLIDRAPSISEAWLLLENLAKAIADMHLHRIPHGNLKPGNIFFDDHGRILLTDFAMGRMPGVSIPAYTDALLYASPEQLSDPKGYLSGKGYSWDTYAFGFLAFQLLTGKIPLCDSTHHRVAPAPHERQVSAAQADVIRLSLDHETLKLSDWAQQAADPIERKRREIIERCLATDPEERYADLSEVLHAWHDVEIETEVREVKSELRQKSKSSRLALTGALCLTAAGVIGCIVLASMLNTEKNNRQIETQNTEDTIDTLKNEHREQLLKLEKSSQDAAKAKTAASAAQKKAEDREAKLRSQLVSLGVANDHLLAWMMRDHSKDLPELNKSGDSRDTLVRELEQFLKITEGNDQFQPVRARVMMQLAELEIYHQKPAKADTMLDSAVAAWTQAGIDEPGHAYRIARARLACLLQALDQQNITLAKVLLPKAREAATSKPSNDDLENQRLDAVMHVIDGRMLESSDPVKALEHFQQAIKGMQGIQRTLTEHLTVRSDLAKYTMEAANLAATLNRVEDAEKLRGDAAKGLEQLLKKNPNLQLPKVQLAQIHIMAATADIREGNDRAGTQKLSQAEELLKTLPMSDSSPDGAAMQMAAAMGLRAVLFRDAGKTDEAKRKLNEAIQLAEGVVSAQSENQAGANEPLYRLAVLHWQLAGLIGDSGDRASELKQGKKSAALMQDLLNKGAGKHDTAIRRALGYLYGDLGHTASAQGDKKAAADYFNQATIIWQSLIKKSGEQEEYTDGLKWSQSRYKEVNGE